jgi:hypothetical protein
VIDKLHSIALQALFDSATVGKMAATIGSTGWIIGSFPIGDSVQATCRTQHRLRAFSKEDVDNRSPTLQVRLYPDRIAVKTDLEVVTITAKRHGQSHSSPS